MTNQLTSLSWASLPGSGDGELARIDLGAPDSIFGVDLLFLNLSGALLDNALLVRVSPDGSTWTEIDQISAGQQSQSRRVAAPAGVSYSARYIVIAQVTPSQTSGRSLTIGAVRVLKEGPTAGAMIEPFTYDDQASYVVIVSAFNGEIYEGGVRQASAVLPYSEGNLQRLDFTQDLDTMLIFHEGYAPHRLFRLGSDVAWDTRGQTFDSMRQIQFADTVYANGVDEVQQLEFFNFTNGDTFNLTLDGVTTSSIVYSNVMATLATSVETALEALPGFSSSDIATGSNSTDRIQITFTGDAGDTAWPQIAPSVVSSTEGVVTSATLTEGAAGGEDAISSTRGWPRCGVFADDRLLLAGLRDLPSTALASRLGEYFEFEAGNLRATDSLEFSIKTGDANGIRRIIEADSILAFTASGVHGLTNDALAADEPIQKRKGAHIGIQLNLKPVELDGGVVYVQRGGRGLREVVYNPDAKRYDTASVSVRAPDVIDQPSSIFSRRTGVSFQDELLGVVNQDGRLAVFTSLKEQDIAAWSRWSIDGLIIAAGADSLARVHMVTERVINGSAVRYVEMVDPDRLLDCSVYVTLDNATAVPGLDHLEGREIYVIAGDNWYGPLTVSGGAVTLPEAYTGTVEAGLFFEAYVDTLDPRFEAGSGSVMDERRRVVSASLSLINSTMPEIVYLGQTYRFKDRRPEARLLDRGPLADPLFTGTTRLEGLQGWDRKVPVRIQRADPGPLHIRALKLGVII